MWSANGKRTGKHPCARQDLAAARRARDLALDLAAYLQQQLLNLEDSSSEKAMQVKQELNEAKKELREANREVDKAKQEVEKASASVQAGRVRAGASACAVVAVAFDLHSRMVVVRFRGGPPLLLFGVVLSSRQGSPRRQSCLHCVHWGLFGVEGLLAASGFTTKNVAAPVLPRGKGTFVAQAKVLRKSFCTSCFAEASERGVNPRLEVGGVSLFSARFDRVLVGAGSEGQRCSEAAVVLAYEAQVTVSVLACLAALLSQVSLVLLSFSMCRGRAGPEKSASVLQGSRSQGTRWKASRQLVSMLGFCTKCQCFSLICYEGPAFCASLCWLQALRGMGGAFGALGCFRFMLI